MKIFVAGSTGVLGKRLVPLLLESGHDVTGLARTAEKGRQLQAMGARVAVADAFDRERLIAVVQEAEPEVVIHELTALGQGALDFKKMDEQFALTNRLRTEVTDTLLAAARQAGARRFIAQSFCGWPFRREGGPIKTEEAPLDEDPPPVLRSTLGAIRHLEAAVRGATDLEALALRYGFFYGPGTSMAHDGPVIELVRNRRFPLVGNGGGVWSFIHADDAAQATAAAVTQGEPGVYNVVDDEPAPVAEWLPYLADVLGAKAPWRVPAWLARFAIGEAGMLFMTSIRGGSNARARRELAWEPQYASWRQGFVEGL